MQKDENTFPTFLIRLFVALALAASAFTVHAAPVNGQGTWETTLQARDLDGDGITDAYYDTVLNITWLANWNVNGRMTWSDAVAWAGDLVVGIYDDWRLPTMTDVGDDGCPVTTYAGGTNTDCGNNIDTSLSELAHLWYVTLGNKAYCSPGDEGCSREQPGWGLKNTANFQNMQSSSYWSGVEYAPNTDGAWYFYTVDGYQGGIHKGFSLYAVAVRPGDMAASVPEPPTLALLGLALMGAACACRKRPD